MDRLIIKKVICRSNTINSHISSVLFSWDLIKHPISVSTWNQAVIFGSTASDSTDLLIYLHVFLLRVYVFLWSALIPSFELLLMDCIIVRGANNKKHKIVSFPQHIFIRSIIPSFKKLLCPIYSWYKAVCSVAGLQIVVEAFVFSLCPNSVGAGPVVDSRWSPF